MKYVVIFIENYVEYEGMLLLGRVFGYKSFWIKFLFIFISKVELWRLYKDVVVDRGYEIVGYTKFVIIWN